jgi:hypothetical protein
MRTAAILFSLTSFAAHAALLAPSATVPLPTGTTLEQQPGLAGQLLEDVTAPFSFQLPQGAMTGSVESQVVRETATGTLDFYWRVNNDASSPVGLGPLFQLNDFVASFYDADWRADSGGSVAPWAAYLVGDINVSHQLYFEFTSQPIPPGQSSYLLLLHTDATQYARTATYMVAPANPIGDQDPANLYATFSPSPVPEPGAWAMLLAGLCFANSASRRSRPRSRGGWPAQR